MRLVQRLWCLLLITLPAVSAHAANTTARLVLSHEAARPGETVLAGIHLRMAPKWHTYWENGGDSGMPTKIDWTLPRGITAASILWPVPRKHEASGLITYIYENEVVLIVPLTLGPDATTGVVDLQAKVSWLECADGDKCVPESSSVSAKLAVGNDSRTSPDNAILDVWKKKLPQPKPASFARASWEKAPGDQDSRPLIIEWTLTSESKDTDFYPFASTNVVVATATEKLTAETGKARVRKSVEKIEGDWPRSVAGLLVEGGDGDAVLTAHQAIIPIAAAPATSGQPNVASADSPLPPGGEKKPLIVWLAFAFLGGLILNLMPCVLPVIALKIFGFVNQSRETPGRVRQLGLIYGLGVLASFLVLAGVVVGLKSVGKQVSWGMQFGDARFLVLMTTLATLVALNLFGLFEVTLGGGAMGAANELASREGAGGAFFNGVLATALATPCSAPFLAGALGFAFAQPSAIIILIFSTVGLGLAAPYVILSFQPAWLKFLPKPGAWMERFKVLMGFPMIATAVWLFTLTTGHYRNALWLGFFLVLVSLAAWIFGQFVQHGQSRKGLALGIVVAILALGYGYGLEKKLRWRTPQAPPIAGGEDEIIQDGPDGIEWRRWSPEKVRKARAEGRPVFVDFTADWCLTCNVNKNSSIEIDSVRKKLKEINALALLGDYTYVPENITQELQRFGRAAVPLVLVYPKDPSKPPVELPAILAPGIVLNALDQAAK